MRAMNSTLTWKIVDDTGAELGVGGSARRKWRQRGVPPKWRIQIAETLMRKSIPVSLSDFERLELTGAQ